MECKYTSTVPQKCSAHKGLMLKCRECVILLTGWSVISLQSKVFRQSLLKLRFCLIILNLCSVMDHALCCEEGLWTGMHDGAVYWGKNHTLTLYMLNFQRKHKHIFTFCVISPHWYDAGSWNPSSNKTRTYLFYIINIMAADVRAT